MPQNAREWREEALAAEEAGDWNRAVVCYRRALSQAPFCGDARAGLEKALEEQLLTEGVTLDDVLRKMAEAEAAVARQHGDEEDDDVEEFSEELEERIAPPRRRRPRKPARSAPAWVTGRRLALTGSVAIAVVLTVAGLFSVAAATSYIKSFFTSASLPEMTTVDELPSELNTMVAAANAMIGTGNPSEAAAKLRAAGERFPGYRETLVPSLVQALRAEGNAELRNGDYKAAAAVFREAADTDSTNDLNWIDLGRALWNQARSGNVAGSPADQRAILSEAESAFRKALALSPEDSAALYGLAQVYDAKNDRKEAVKTYERLVAIAPSSFEGKMAVSQLEQLRR